MPNQIKIFKTFFKNYVLGTFTYSLGDMTFMKIIKFPLNTKQKGNVDFS